jgi:hypothetical protein
MSTFNAGKSRNFDVNKYNIGQGRVSIFTGGTRVNPWPNISVVGNTQDKNNNDKSDRALGIDEQGNSIYQSYTRRTLHNNDVYDTSLLNIIEKLSLSRAAALRPSDFAYLKDLGRFPNNRLMIARKFLSPISDDLNKIRTQPKSILITWKPEGEEFLDITYGEQWTEADADFTNVLNKMGEDFMGKSMGSKLSAALNLIPLPGFTETIQQVVLEKLGVLESGAANRGSPAGNPNVIKIAKRRKTPGTGEPFSGLKYEVSIKMICEYEQKFISGIDPTVAFIDIVQNALAFGTQDSTSYGLSGAFAAKISKWASNPWSLLSEFATLLVQAFNKIQQTIKNAVKEAVDKIQKQIKEAKQEPNDPEGSDDEDDDSKAEVAELEKQQGFIQKAGRTLKNFIGLIAKSIEKTVAKYREELRGIANALSGAPSTPWHVTIGNPLRPMFCSGDMYTDDVKLQLGPTLAFNDLPTSIKVDFTLKPGRPRGLQEIMAKFNTGNLRVVNVRRDLNQTENPLEQASYMYDDPRPVPLQGNPNAANSQNVNNSSSGTGGAGSNRENSNQETNNRNANSSSATNGTTASGITGTSGISSSSARPTTSSGNSGTGGGTGGTSG